jgi:Fe2+ or Zn2+ uptake regulation protein
VKTTQLDLESARQRHLERLCRQHHLPVTIQRRAVYEALCRRQDHPSADQLHLEVKATVPGLSRASIYRILEALVAMGAARKCPESDGRRSDCNDDVRESRLSTEHCARPETTRRLPNCRSETRLQPKN